ncbi:hypothetical protein B7494_g3418 [Chlorociboria aeruginascens]|nr:hypothetical protein B7494_g3418 [Chlorociboria aeruginascens]
MGKINRSLPPDANPQQYANLIRKNYNLGDVFYLDLWPLSWPQMMILDPGLATEVTQVRNLPKGAFIRNFLGPLLGTTAMVAVSGDEHKFYRGLFNHGFSTLNMLRHVPDMVEKTKIFVDILKDRSLQGAIFPMEEATSRLSFDIMGAVIFDTDFNSQRTDYILMTAFRELAHLLPTFLLERYLTNVNPFVRWRRRKLAQSIDGEIERLLRVRFNSEFGRKRRVDKQGAHIVDVGYKSWFKGDFAAKGDVVPVLDRSFLKTFTVQCKTFLLAGHDTSSSSVCYAYHLLSQHPEVLQKLRDEHNRILGTDIDDAPRLLKDQPALLQKLEYTMAVIKEVLRIYPPIGGSYRHGEKDVSLIYNGIPYPTYPFAVIIVGHAIMRDEKLFHEPLHFYPERYFATPPSPYFVPKDAWRAFERGPRNCIGEAMAVVQMKIILAMTVRSFDIRAAYEGEGPIIEGERMYQTLDVTAKPKDSMPARSKNEMQSDIMRTSRIGILIMIAIILLLWNPQYRSQYLYTANRKRYLSTANMKVIVAGLPRTATVSIKEALEHLDFAPSYHHITRPTRYDRIKESTEILACRDKKERQERLRKLFDGFESVLEHPAGPCLDDLLEMYPDVKVILSLRKNADVWLDSFYGCFCTTLGSSKKTMGPDLRSIHFRFLTLLIPGIKNTSNLHEAWLAQCNERWGINEASVDLYHAHNEWVRSIVPPERLLEFQPSMGWEPLCQFLGKDAKAIDIPFPRLNPREYLKGWINLAMLVGSVAWVGVFVLLIALMIFFYTNQTLEHLEGFESINLKLNMEEREILKDLKENSITWTLLVFLSYPTDELIATHNSSFIKRAPMGAWTQTFYDEFLLPAGELPLSSWWQIRTGTSYPGGSAQWGNGEAETYTSSTTNIVTTGDSSLMITPVYESGTGWTSGRIESLSSFMAKTGGKLYIEARLKLPSTALSSSVGLWYAFWALGTSFRTNGYNTWPACTEWDFFESINGAASISTTAHCGTITGGPCNEPTGQTASSGFSRGAWHILGFAVDRTNSNWQAQSLTWFVDGATVHTLTGSTVGNAADWSALAAADHYLVLNVAVGGGWPGQPNAATRGGSGTGMEIDYVGVWNSS